MAVTPVGESRLFGLQSEGIAASGSSRIGWPLPSAVPDRARRHPRWPGLTSNSRWVRGRIRKRGGVPRVQRSKPFSMNHRPISAAISSRHVPSQNELLATLASATRLVRSPTSRSVTVFQSLSKYLSRSSLEIFRPYPAPVRCRAPLFQAVAGKLLWSMSAIPFDGERV